MMNLAKLFGSISRAKLLEKFVIEEIINKNNPGFFIRELCRETDEQLNSVRRELINLENLKILRSKEDYKKKLYFLNKGCNIYNELIEIFIKNYNGIEQLKKFFKGRKNVELITVSESVKTVDAKSNNIVDIFVIGELDKSEFNDFLERAFFGRKLKYAIMTLADFEKRLGYNDRLVLNILKQKGNLFLRDSLGIEEKLKGND